VASKFKSDYHIHARREVENRERDLVNQIRQNSNLVEKAKWEHKSDKVIQGNIVKNAVNDMRKRKASDLNGRKARLAAMLGAEDKLYEQEYMSTLETPEQVRAKMAEKLKVIKGNRELERQ